MRRQWLPLVIVLVGASLADVSPAAAVAPGANGRIAFVCQGAICTVRPDGSGLARLPAGSSPDWSPDGQWLAFTRYRAENDTDLLVMRADGSQERMLPKGRAMNDGQEYGTVPESPVWTRGGARIVVAERLAANFGCTTLRTAAFAPRQQSNDIEKCGNRLISMAADGSDRRVVTSPAGGIVAAVAPVAGPAGDRLAFTARGGGRDRLVVTDAEGGGLRELRPGYWHVVDWTPDGRRLLAQEFDTSSGFVLARGGPQWLDAESGATIEPAARAGSVSPDGARVAFGDGEDVRTSALDGSGECVIAQGGDPDWGPSRDGDPAAFAPAGCPGVAPPPEPVRCDATGGRVYDGDKLQGGGRLGGTERGDVLLGADGDDVLSGRAGGDCALGAGGKDLLFGGAGADVLDGGAGDDRLDGKDGPDDVRGGAGHDRVVGGADRDRLDGGDGNDLLADGLGRNRYFGGRGNDTIVARQSVAERIDCGPGRDEAFVDRRDTVRGCEKVVGRMRTVRRPPGRSPRRLRARASASWPPVNTWFNHESSDRFFYGFTPVEQCTTTGGDGFGTIYVKPVVAWVERRRKRRYMRIEFRQQVWAYRFRIAGYGWETTVVGNRDAVSRVRSGKQLWFAHGRRVKLSSSDEYYRMQVKFTWYQARRGRDEVKDTDWFSTGYCQAGGGLPEP